MVASLALMTLSGCASNGIFRTPPPKETTAQAAEKRSRNLPAAPGFMSPVYREKPSIGSDAKLEFAKERAHSANLNARLVQSRKWYDGVRRSFSVKK